MASLINTFAQRAKTRSMSPKRWSETRESLAALAKLADEAMSKKSPMSEMELGIEEEKRALGQRLMDEKLTRLPSEDGRPKSCPRCGKRVPVRAKAVPRTFKSLSGTHTFSRNYHYCQKCEYGFYPQDKFLGLAEDAEMTEQLERRVADFVVNDTFDAGVARMKFHYGLELSSNAFRLVAQRLGTKLEASNEVVLHSGLLAPPKEDTPLLYVLNDGSMVSTRDGWKEVKTAVVFRDHERVASEEDVRGFIECARYVSVLGAQQEFKASLRNALRSENAGCAKKVVWIADGAIGNWSLASMVCPKAIQILDWYHAIEHAALAAKILLGEGASLAVAFTERIRTLLWNGQVDVVLAELKSCLPLCESAEQRTAIRNLRRYYRNNAHRMDYRTFRQQGLLIGSGIIESAHRHVIQTRMKKAGQHWGNTGGRRMARMRAAYRTAGPDRFYDAIHWAYRETRAAPRIRKPAKRYASNR